MGTLCEWFLTVGLVSVAVLAFCEKSWDWKEMENNARNMLITLGCLIILDVFGPVQVPVRMHEKHPKHAAATVDVLNSTGRNGRTSI